MNVAVILAGGIGSRLNNEVPKQFIKVAGKTIIEHTIQTFQEHRLIDEICVVVHECYISQIESLIIANGWSKVKKVLSGGKSRAASSLVAINAYEGKKDFNIIFHDAVRPLVSNQIITKVISALEQYQAVDVAIPSVDTIIKVNKERIITGIPSRETLFRGQTPQGFKYSVIKKAYELFLEDNKFEATDDCGIVLKYLPDIDIYVVSGEETNMKVTYVEDLYLLDKRFQLRTTSIEGDLNRDLLKDKVVVVFGGNAGIGKDICKLVAECGGRSYSFSRTSTQTDIKNIEDVKSSLAEVAKKEGKIDFVVNTAAILNRQPLHLMKYEHIVDLVNVNYLGMINVSIASYNYLKESSGQLLHFTSSSYTRGRAFYSLYSSSKSAVVNFVQAIAEEWLPAGVRVNCINPERTNTPMRTRNFGNEPIDTLLSSKNVARVAVKTLTSNFTGQVIDVRIN